jgi:hypothetical protein
MNAEEQGKEAPVEELPRVLGWTPCPPEAVRSDMCGPDPDGSQSDLSSWSWSRTARVRVDRDAAAKLDGDRAARSRTLAISLLVRAHLLGRERRLTLPGHGATPTEPRIVADLVERNLEPAFRPSSVSFSCP